MKYLLAAVMLIAGFRTQAQKLDSLLRVAASKPLNEETLDWMCNLAYDYHMIDPKITEELGVRAIELATDLGSPMEIGKAHHLVGISYWTRGLAQTAITYYHDAHSFYEQAGDARRANAILLDIASIYGDTKNYEKSFPLQRKVLKNAEASKDSLVLTWVLNNMAEQCREYGLLDSAQLYFIEGLGYAEALADTAGILLVHNNVASLLIDREKYDEALDHLKLARGLLDHKQIVEWHAEVLINFSKCELANGNLGEAIAYLDSAKIQVDKMGSRKLKEVLLDSYSKVYERLNDFEKAHFFYKKSRELGDSISGVDVKNQVEILQLEYENERNERNLAQLEIENAQNEIQLYRIAIASAVVIIIALVFIFSQRQKVLDAELREKYLTHILEKKNRELASYTVFFLQKEKIIEELKAKIDALKKQTTSSTFEELSRLDKMIDESFKVSNDWEQFKLIFEEIHPDFFRKLRDRFEGIGSSDLKLCALLKLNFSLKESAEVLGISSDSVKTSRYRLKKKLGLEKHMKVSDFVKTL
jgi:tetratricopeptide (TPR) repeat protein